MRCWINSDREDKVSFRALYCRGGSTQCRAVSSRRRRARSAIVLGAVLYLSFSLAVGADLSGRVTKDGKSASGVTVRLDPARPPATGPARTAKTDPNGEYTFKGLVPGEYRLSCGSNSVPAPVRDRQTNTTDCTL